LLDHAQQSGLGTDFDKDARALITQRLRAIGKADGIAQKLSPVERISQFA
jgi:hypothetical protein